MSVNHSDIKAPSAAAAQKTHSAMVRDRYRGNDWCSHVSLSVHPPSSKVTAKTRKYFCNSCGKRISKSDTKLSVIRKVLAPRFPVEKALFYHLSDRCARDPVTMTMKYGLVFPIPDQVKGYDGLSLEIKQQLTRIIMDLSLSLQTDPEADTHPLQPLTHPNDTNDDQPLKYQAVEENSAHNNSDNSNLNSNNNNNNNNINSNDSNNDNSESNSRNDINGQSSTQSACLRRRVPKANADRDYRPDSSKRNRTSDKQRFTAACRLAVAPQINTFRAANIESVCSSSPSGKVRCEVSGEMISASSAQIDHAAPNTFQVIVDRFLQREGQRGRGSVGQFLKRTAYVYGHFFDLRLRDGFAAFHQSQASLRVVKSTLNQGILKRKATTDTV